jgi:hypothetical protein
MTGFAFFSSLKQARGACVLCSVWGCRRELWACRQDFHVAVVAFALGIQ